MGSEHKINGFVVQWCFSDKIKIIYPCGKVLWTNSFSVVREEMESLNANKNNSAFQLKLF